MMYYLGKVYFEDGIPYTQFRCRSNEKAIFYWSSDINNPEIIRYRFDEVIKECIGKECRFYIQE